MIRYCVLSVLTAGSLLGCQEDTMGSMDAGSLLDAAPRDAAFDGQAADVSERDARADVGDASVDSVAPDVSMPDAGAVDSGISTPCIEAGRPLPVIPCGVGFGMETAAGSGRHLDTPETRVYRVSSLEARGEGTLAECAQGSGPRVCVFEVSGVIELTDHLVIDEPYLTIAGQTAPSPGISIHGGGIRVEANDVLISHLRIRVGDRRRGPPVHNRDAIGISNRNVNPRRVVIDHCSLAFSSDEMFSVWYGAGDVTLYESLLGLPLHDSIHVDEGASEPAPHGLGALFGPETSRVAMVRTVLAHHRGRNPLSRADGLVMVNNLIYNWGSNVTALASVNGSINRSTLVGNLYIPGRNSSDRPVIQVSSLPSGSEIFLADNIGPGLGSDPWSLVEGNESRRVEAPPLVYDGYEFGPADALQETLLSNIGAWPTARDAVDERIIEEIRTETGRIINCVEDDGSDRCEANAGGWPVLDENTRTLELPPRPNADDDGDGYTNLEAWLFAFRDGV